MAIEERFKGYQYIGVASIDNSKTIAFGGKLELVKKLFARLSKSAKKKESLGKLETIWCDGLTSKEYQEEFVMHAPKPIRIIEIFVSSSDIDKIGLEDLPIGMILRNNCDGKEQLRKIVIQIAVAMGVAKKRKNLFDLFRR